MQYIETKSGDATGNAALLALLNKARQEEKRDQHLAVSVRIAKLAIQIQQKEMTTGEIIELLSQESERFEHSAQELSA